MDDPVLVYTTWPDTSAAERAGRILIQDRLAACVNILPGMMSLYRWENKVQQSSEAVMLIKTRSDLVERVMASVREHHSYDTPAILVIEIADADPQFAAWIRTETQEGEG